MKRNQKHTFLIAFALLLAVGFGRADAQENIAQQAYAILEHSCNNCHGAGGSFTESLLIEHTALIEPGGAVVPGNPFASSLYMRLIDPDPTKRMPLGQPQLSQEAMTIIGQWIQNGAPNWEVEHDVSFISTGQMLTAMETHLATLPTFDRPFARYFTTTHLYNAGESPDTLRDYPVALSKLVNSLSWGFSIINPIPIDAAETIFYIDTRDYEWDIRDAWEHIEDAYPYNIAFDAQEQAGLREQLLNLQSEMRCDVPYVQVDWFIAAAALPPLYHDILDLPTTDTELERQLNIDVAANLADAPGRRVWRAGFNDSGVSTNNRVVERHVSSYGAYWKSYDFASNFGLQNIFTNPLTFQEDGGEVIFNLPNGLQAYLITDGFGNRIDVAPTDIVSNPAADDPRVHNGLSCFGCHTEGMKQFEDTVRDVVDQTANLPNKEHALRLYVEQAIMDSRVQQDIQRFEFALQQTGGEIGGIEPIHRFFEVFQGPIDVAYAAAAVGLQTAAFEQRIVEEPALQNLGLTGLLTGENVKRDVWEGNFQDIVQVLNNTDFQPTLPTGTTTTTTTRTIILPPYTPPPFVPTPAAVLSNADRRTGIIPDPNLHAAVADALGKNANAVITADDMTRLERLIADDSGIIELTGLEHAVNLERIELRRNLISDLSPIRELRDLNNIKLRGNLISDVEPLAGLFNVDWLGLEENQITDVSALRGLTRLNGIGLEGNPISDISPLAGMLSLDGVGVMETNVTDFSSLADLPRFVWIEWGNIPATQLPNLTGLTRLRRLVIRNTNISDISGLSLTSLANLQLNNNLIGDVSVLSRFTALTELRLDNNIITDVSPLASLENLTQLNLENNAISDFSPLEELPDTTHVQMQDNPGFPNGGPKITGPWLWAIVPGTRLNDSIDFLSRATGGAATEIKVSTNGATEGKQVGERKWARHSISTSNNNINRMTDALGWGTGSEIYDHIVYGSVVLDTPAAQDTTMFVGSDDACKVWLNGELVHKAYVRRGSSNYQEFFSVSLKQGKNVLLVALDNHGHGGFSGFFGFAPDALYEVHEEPTGFSFSEQTEELAIGDTFTLQLNAARVDSLGGWQTDIVFDANVLRVNSITEGDFMTQGGGTTHFSEGTLRNQLGKITGIQVVQLEHGEMGRNGTILEIEFRARANGEGFVRLENFQAADRIANKIHAIPPETTIVVGSALAAPNKEPDVIPEETALLANYPNPFNPETWIPYHLSAPADVTVRIYATDGTLIRHLTVGHQAAGVYQHRGRAAYWDGRNAAGEPVASGLYFYTLTAGEFTATRKLLILK